MALILLVVAGVTGVGGCADRHRLERRLVDGVDRELVSRSNVVAPKPGHEGRRPPGPRDGDPDGDGGTGGGDGTGGDGGEPSPFDVRRYAFVDLDRGRHVINTVTSGPERRPRSPARRRPASRRRPVPLTVGQRRRASPGTGWS